MIFSEGQIRGFINLYKILSVLAAVFVLPLLLLPLLFQVRYLQFFVLILIFTTPCSIYFGLKRKATWVIPVIILIAILGIFGNVQLLFNRPDGIVQVIFHLLLTYLGIFTIYFFSRKEVKLYFKK